MKRHYADVLIFNASHPDETRKFAIPVEMYGSVFIAFNRKRDTIGAGARSANMEKRLGRQLDVSMCCCDVMC